jgi:hypothetical protein
MIDVKTSTSGLILVVIVATWFTWAAVVAIAAIIIELNVIVKRIA